MKESEGRCDWKRKGKVGGLGFFMVCLMTVILIRNLQRAESASDSLDFEVAASCLPHSEIDLPSSLQLKYGFVGTAQASSIEATLRTGIDLYEPSDAKFGVPERGWVSIIFPGPVIRVNLYCQNIADSQPFYLSADRFSRMRIYLSRNGSFSQEELASSQTIQKSELRVSGSGRYKNEFAFGKDTDQPYWLQFGLSFAEPLSLDGRINFEVR